MKRKNPRSLKNQLHHAISTTVAFGQSKRSALPDDRANKVYSIGRADDLRATAKSFGGWLQANHPEIRWVKDIQQDHVQEYLNAKKSTWSKHTLEEKCGQMGKLGTICGNAFNGAGWSRVDVMPAPESRGKIRNVTMSQEHLAALRNSFQGSKSAGAIGIEIAARCGLRSAECAALRGRDIDLEKKELFVSREGAKNGRERFVPIRDKDIGYFETLKTSTGDSYCCRGVSAEGINHAIREHMRDLGISEFYPCSTIHSIRKAYAQERMEELRGPDPLPDRTEEIRTWDTVSHELGHGDDRIDLYNTYIGGR